MKSYKSPKLISYKSKDITEIAGPCQAQAYEAYLDVGGGRQAMFEKIEYQKECVSPKIKLARIETKAKTTA